MTRATVIKPCLYCGGPAVASAFNAIGGRLQPEGAPMRSNVSYEAYVGCHECGARGPLIEADALAVFEGRDVASLDELKALAVARWNERRAPEPAA